MLSRTEIATRILPAIDIRACPISDFGFSSENNANNSTIQPSRMSNKNLIRKALLMNSDINLYLPTMIFNKPKEIVSSFERERNEKANKTESNANGNGTKMQIANHPTEVNHTIPRRRGIIPECQSKDYLSIKARFKGVHDKLKTFKEEIPKPMEGKAPFNLKELTKQVKQITKSVKLNLKTKEDIALRYRLHSIANKKDSRPVEEFLRLEKSIENLYLQKVILNIEYDNVVNERKRAKHNTIKRRADLIPMKYSPQTTVKDKSAINTHTQSHRTMASSQSGINKKRVLITETNKQQHKDREEKKREKDALGGFDQQYFMDKYERCLSNIIDEEKEHQDKKVFTSNEIERIMKSKKDIILDGLKNEYVNKFNENVELKTKIEQKGTDLFRHIELKHKEEQQRRIGKKINQALVYSEEGNLDSMRYQIKDYIKGCDYNFTSK